MRELIALRAKIDLLEQDKQKNKIYGDTNIITYASYRGMLEAYDEIRQMIDDMVSKQLEVMYEEHLQEEASQTN